jgi:Cu-Zn family superoxide dismutase
MKFTEIQDTSCPRTRATECSCSSVKKISESAETVKAYCVLSHSDTVKGTILFLQKPGTPTLIQGRIEGLTAGEHGFHIHEYGDMSDGCASMGGHYNPDAENHGSLDKGHVGDLGNVTANEQGVADFTIVAERVDLVGDRSVIGRGLVIHADPDDLGQGGDAESLKTGNAGDRLACGIIAIKQ